MAFVLSMSCPFFYKLQKLSRLTLLPSFNLLNRSVVQVSFLLKWCKGSTCTCLLVDSKEPRELLKTNRSVGNQGGRLREQNIIRVRNLFERFLYK